MTVSSNINFLFLASNFNKRMGNEQRLNKRAKVGRHKNQYLGYLNEDLRLKRLQHAIKNKLQKVNESFQRSEWKTEWDRKKRKTEMELKETRMVKIPNYSCNYFRRLYRTNSKEAKKKKMLKTFDPLLKITFDVRLGKDFSFLLFLVFVLNFNFRFIAFDGDFMEL